MVTPKQSDPTWLHPIAEAELENLKADGINATWEQVAMIQTLAQRADNPTLKRVTATGKPATCKGRTFWPFTIQAGEWYTWACDTLPAEDLLFFALLYAHEHGRVSDGFSGLYEVAEAVDTLKAYKRGLPFTGNEALQILEELNGHAQGNADSDPVDMDETLSLLVAETGIEPEIWLCRVSLAYVSEQIRILNAKASETPPEMKAEYIEAERALGLALLTIRKEARDVGC